MPKQLETSEHAKKDFLKTRYYKTNILLIMEYVKKYFEENDVNYIDAKVGCTVGIHSGIKACGIFFIEK